MKALIPAAGLGVRLLPFTKVVPKELLPVRGKPAVHWTLEEATRAGLRHFIVVLSPSKPMLRDYLTPLEDNHALIGYPEMDELDRLLRSVQIAFVEQPKPVGFGDALLRCRHLIGGESFAVLLPDNVLAGFSLLERMIELNRAHGRSCVGLQRATGATKDAPILADLVGESVYRVRRVFPKGAPGKGTSGLRPIGRFVLQPEAFGYLERAESEGGELDDVPMLDGLARDGLLLGVLTSNRLYHLGADAHRGLPTSRRQRLSWGDDA